MSDVATAPTPTTAPNERPASSPPRPVLEAPAAFAPHSSGRAPAAPAARASRGLSPAVVILAIVAVAAVLWAAWMTKTVNDLKANKAPFVSVRLQPLVEEYVQAQARTSTPEDQVTRETQAFMATIDAELRARGQRGETVIVGEAVLSKNIPDITDDVRKAVYAKVATPGSAVGAAAAAAGVGTNGLGR